MNNTTRTQIIASQVPPLLDRTDRRRLRDYFINTWGLNELLFSSIPNEETFLLRPDPLRNPLIFYWGHTAVFYINKLRMAGLLKKGINEHFEELFAIGVDPESGDDLDKTQVWPSLKELSTYRDRVFETVREVIEKFPEGEAINPGSPWWALLMGLEHDRIHFETSSVLFRQLPADRLNRPRRWTYAETLGNPPVNNLIGVTGGTIILGKPSQMPIFGWDNEYGHLKKEVAPFTASQNLISNAEFLEFVGDGGYQRKEFWTDEGFNWVRQTGIANPKFWVGKNDTFLYRAIFDVLPFPKDFPVEVNALEARAFCRWKGGDWRLLTEAEFGLIAGKELKKRGEPAFSDEYNLHLKYGSPTPVGFFAREREKPEFNDLYGNVWDWLSDDFYSLPGFQTHPLYEDFSVPYFDPQHSMLLGGSWATTGTGAASFYRLWFRRNFFQHAGFRLAKSLS